MKKKPGWVRDQSVGEIKVTFLVSRESEPLLHAYLASLPFRGTSVEVRRLLKAALIREAGGTVSEQDPVPQPVARPVPAPRPAVEPLRSDVASGAKPVVKNNPTPPYTHPASTPGNGRLSKSDIDTIALLDSMSD